jgi:hypothetical protein
VTVPFFPSTLRVAYIYQSLEQFYLRLTVFPSVQGAFSLVSLR